MSDLKPASTRVATAAAAAGLSIEVVVHARPTRTAEQAALACQCPVGAIVKSLVFSAKTSGQPVLLLVSGANRVDEAIVGAQIGDALVRPDAQVVRDVTGFAIGGIPPLGHSQALVTYIDEDLLAFATVWAAAGTPDSVFSVAPAALAAAIDAKAIRMKSA